MPKEVKGIIILRNDTLEKFNTANPILRKGEVVIINSNNTIRIGDGINPFVALPEFNSLLLNGRDGAYYSNYNNLNNKPIIPTVGTINTDNATSQVVSISESLGSAIKLHKISKTGKYTDLIGLPTIPTSLPNPNSLTIGGVSYNGATAVTIDKVAKAVTADTATTADTAATATKVSNALNISGIVYDGSIARSITIPTSLPNPNSLTIGGISYNGATAVTIDKVAKAVTADTATKVTNDLTLLSSIGSGSVSGSYNGSVANKFEFRDVNISSYKYYDITSATGIAISKLENSQKFYVYNVANNVANLTLQLDGFEDKENNLPPGGFFPDLYTSNIMREWKIRLILNSTCNIKVINNYRIYSTSDKFTIKEVKFNEDLFSLTEDYKIIELSIIDEYGTAIGYDKNENPVLPSF